MAITPRYVDPEGEGTPYPNPGTLGTVYNGSQSCELCGVLMNPLQALHSDLCTNCHRKIARRRLDNRMA